MISCHDCSAELDHCHGSLVMHEDGTVECTETSCGALDTARHGLSALACTDVDRQCTCLVAAQELLVAS